MKKNKNPKERWSLTRFLRCKHDKENLIFIKNIYGDQINQFCGYRSIWYCNKCNTEVYLNEVYDIGNYSDGYHTFNELYHHRAILFAVVCNQFKDKCWKSFRHHDGSMYTGMFIVGIETPKGPATYHYNANEYWFLFDVKELNNAPKWDGHTPQDAIERIQSLIKK